MCCLSGMKQVTNGREKLLLSDREVNSDWNLKYGEKAIHQSQFPLLFQIPKLSPNQKLPEK